MTSKTFFLRSLLVLPAALLLMSCASQEEIEQELVRPVVTMITPEPGQSRERHFSGTARAEVETMLSFRVGGKIHDLHAKLGQAVKAGDLIAELDNTDYELQVKQSQAQLAQADACLEQARAEYGRTRQLYEAENVSKSSLDTAQAAFKSAVARRDAALKGLELVSQQLEYCKLHAPMDGSIASVSVEEHQAVQAGQTIATLAAGNVMEVEIGAPGALITKLRVGLAAKIEFEAIPNQVFDALVSEVGMELSHSSTYPVKLQLLSADTRIRPGMIGEVVLSFSHEKEGVIYVPPVAVVGTPDGERYVWIYAQEHGTVSRRLVKTDALTSDGLQIVEGLTTGERIVIRGVHQLQEGMKVRLLQDVLR